ncbi:solute carrier family 35 member G2-like, putative [Babesia caballi]|uniref:Solute carrier family 35 member G2-like, putative n=1 Tax=Babesia caballi TaxID=5871 RepID=A0AAV4LP50_BABCB|nr:solute carrier family 35 member G2-like, putative [Babesia caballi]
MKNNSQRIQSEFDHLQFLLSGIKQGRMFETSRTFESEGVFTARSDDTSAFDRNALFVDKDTVLLDSLTFLETVLRFASEDDYDYILSTTVDTSEGRVQLSPFLTNLYYLLTYFHYYMLSQTAPLYKMEPLQDRYAVMFQKCLFHRCKMLALSCLLAVVRHNVVIRPVESADYCYNWLLVFTQIGGEEYDFDRSVIEKDLRDINFLDHVDEWNSISGTWCVVFCKLRSAFVFRLPAELQQIKSMVSSTAKEAPVEASDDINQIKEITGITDTAVIQECLEKHDFDISNAIMDLFNAVKEQPRPLAQPAKQTIVDPSLSMRFLPKESRQAVLNYWLVVCPYFIAVLRDYVNRPELYDDDYESEDEFDGDVVPLNAKALYDDIISSDGDSDGGKDHASKENDIGSVAGPPKMTFQPKGGSARSQHKEGNATSSRGNRGRRNFNRKRNTINMDAFG